MDYVGNLVVENASGDRFKMYRYRGRVLFKPAERFVLSDGKKVRRIDFNNYETVQGGEKLTRVMA